MCIFACATAFDGSVFWGLCTLSGTAVSQTVEENESIGYMRLLNLNNPISNLLLAQLALALLSSNL